MVTPGIPTGDWPLPFSVCQMIIDNLRDLQVQDSGYGNNENRAAFGQITKSILKKNNGNAGLFLVSIYVGWNSWWLMYFYVIGFLSGKLYQEPPYGFLWKWRIPSRHHGFNTKSWSFMTVGWCVRAARSLRAPQLYGWPIDPGLHGLAEFRGKSLMGWWDLHVLSMGTHRNSWDLNIT